MSVALAVLGTLAFAYSLGAMISAKGAPAVIAWSGIAAGSLIVALFGWLLLLGVIA